MSSKRQLQHITKLSVPMPIAPYTASQTSSTIDMQGYESLTVFALVTSWTSGTVDFALWDSPDNITFTLVPALLIDSNGFVQVKDATLNATVMSATYMGYQRYVQVRAAGATTPSATFGCVALQGFPRNSLP